MVNTKLRQKIDTFTGVVFDMYPDAKTELQYENEFQLLIAILMSAQTTDRQVNKVNRNFFMALKTPQDWIDLWVEEIILYIDSISFFNNKAKNIYKTCEKLIKEYDWKIPKTLKELTGLYWVWIKTAKVFLAVTEDATFLAVDTNVHRVLNRVWIVKAKTQIETEKKDEEKKKENADKKETEKEKKVLDTDDYQLHEALVLLKGLSILKHKSWSFWLNVKPA